ncbi:hypothetical protein CYMTET_21030 [Cymbomonas tetramitiformis]|uniref:Uncharacterized protein n=1 Tax=Cymbomonas tetramitiformis TaxID=36881 RepID=A0AAE0G2U0_9CHLO|nr:hypothetical protein CYMTET_21030 [Cymbomonas tetramitiformis]
MVASSANCAAGCGACRPTLGLCGPLMEYCGWASSFEYNVAEVGSGGALYSAGNLTMTASLCVGNTAQQGGSAFLDFALPSQVVEQLNSKEAKVEAAGTSAVAKGDKELARHQTLPYWPYSDCNP